MTTQRNVKIFVGISGSGKSTHGVNLVARENPATSKHVYTICSADPYFLDEDGEYVFDVKKLPEAHNACFLKFINWLRGEPRGLGVIETALIDNTNCSAAEVAPYIAASRAYGIEPEVLHFVADRGVAFARNKHGVPHNVINAQDASLSKMMNEWPAWWPRVKRIKGNQNVHSVKLADRAKEEGHPTSADYVEWLIAGEYEAVEALCTAKCVVDPLGAGAICDHGCPSPLLVGMGL